MTAYEKSQNVWIIGGFVLISTICVSPMLFFGKTLVLRDTFFEFRFLYPFNFLPVIPRLFIIQRF